MPNGVSANQPHQPVTHQADPEVYGQSPIDLVKSVLRARRQEPLHAEVNGVPRQHGDQGLPERALEQPYRGRSPGPRGSQCRVASCICALDSRDRVSVTWPAFAPSETLPQARLRDHRHTGRRRTFAEPVAALAECVKLDAYAKLICQQNSPRKSSTPLSLDLRNRSGTSTHRSVNYGRCCPVAIRKQPPHRKLRNANGER